MGTLKLIPYKSHHEQIQRACILDRLWQVYVVLSCLVVNMESLLAIIQEIGGNKNYQYEAGKDQLHFSVGYRVYYNTQGVHKFKKSSVLTTLYRPIHLFNALVWE